MRHVALTSQTQSCRSSKHHNNNSTRAGCAAGETCTLVTRLHRGFCVHHPTGMLNTKSQMQHTSVATESTAFSETGDLWPIHCKVVALASLTSPHHDVEQETLGLVMCRMQQMCKLVVMTLTTSIAKSIHNMKNISAAQMMISPAIEMWASVHAQSCFSAPCHTAGDPPLSNTVSVSS